MATKSLTFVTAQELDPFTAIALNARFYGFLASFSKANHIDFTTAVETARTILENAEIPQV